MEEDLVRRSFQLMENICDKTPMLASGCRLGSYHLQVIFNVDQIFLNIVVMLRDGCHDDLFTYAFNKSYIVPINVVG